MMLNPSSSRHTHSQSIKDTPMMACTRCGITQPFTKFSKSTREKNGHRTTCKACISAAGAEYRARMGQILLDRGKAYRDRVGPTILKEKAAAKYLKQKEVYAKKAAEYYKNNKEKIKLAAAEWRKQNPEGKRASHATRRARKKLSGGTHNAGDIKSLMLLQKGKCPICAICIKNKYHIDHIQPVATGGSNDRLNIQLLCPTCNMSKKAMDPIEYMQRRGFLL